MYKHIVVAVDGSRTALNALQHAIDLALGLQSQLTLITVANPAEYMTLAPEFLQYESYEEAAIAGSNEVLSDMQKVATDAGVQNVQTHLLMAAKGTKEMAQELVDFADETGADLIVIGTHGRTGLMHLLMGSFAETVMRQSHLPLLVIRSRKENNVVDEE